MSSINYKNTNELVSLYNNNSFEELIYKAKLLLKKDPNNYFLNNICGMTYVRLSNFKKASEFFSKAIKINPNNYEAFNNLATCLSYLGKFEESVESYKKALKNNPNSAEIFNNLGNTFKDLGKFDEAINYYFKSLNVNSNFKNAKNNIIKTLAFHNPKKINTNPFFLVSKKLQSLNIKFDQKKRISDLNIKIMFNKWIDITKDYFNDLEYEYSQIYRLQTNDLNCERHHKVFNTFNVIPKNCFGCYKVQANPKNVIDLIKLYLIFDKLDLKNNNNRKTFCEIRPYIASTYVGLIYCYSFDEASEVKNKLKKLYSKFIDKNNKILIKRGCSEFSLAHPDYKETDKRAKNFMKYDESWSEKEKIVDSKIPERDKLSKRFSNKHITGINLHDVLSIRNWLIYAKKINDYSYKKIYSDKLNSSYMDKNLSNQLKIRMDNFSSKN